MRRDKTCIVPKCHDATLTKIELESSYTVERYACHKCGRLYTVPTTAGKVNQLAGLASIGLLGVALLRGDLEGVIEDMTGYFA